MLKVESLVSGYGNQRVLDQVSFAVELGASVGLIGPNGAGKSTTAASLIGLQPIWNGRVVFDGNDVSATPPRVLLSGGLRLVPQEGGTFPSLTVAENLSLATRFLDREGQEAGRETALRLFPMLADRLKERAGALSGGQQQMLAVGSAIAGRPRVLILDEPSLGLAPNLFDRVLGAIDEVRAHTGMAVLLIEQNVQKTLAHVERVLIMREGAIVHQAPSSDLVLDDLWRYF